MNTQPKPKFSLKTSYLGPVFSLECEFSNRDQNVIFARNGTGKSFLSRGFRYLDLFGQSENISDAATNLVSDESPDGKGEFAFLHGSDVLGKIKVEKGNENPDVTLNDTIFHVFSEEFVDQELRERTYQVSGEIENQIAVDSKSIEIDDAKSAYAKAAQAENSAKMALKTKFENERVSELVDKAGVSKRLKEYDSLDFDKLKELYIEIPEIPEKNFSDALKELDKLKSIPSEPAYPKLLPPFVSQNMELETIRQSLAKVTSPSSVSASFKSKIDENREFYKTGLSLVQTNESDECPFCEQSLSLTEPKEVIDTYIEYFSAEEEKHKSELRELYRKLSALEQELKNTKINLASQSNEFDSLKVFIPSQKQKALDESEHSFENALTAISSIKKSIEVKAKSLSVPIDLPEQTLSIEIGRIDQAIEKNNGLVEALNTAVNRSDEERKLLQRNVCDIFQVEFAIKNWSELEEIRTLQSSSKEKLIALTVLEKSNPSTNAKERVAETFDLLLNQFFPEKYIFDKEKFILKRGEHFMTRGPHRTLSDGEKTAIAFCYFVAAIHSKVSANTDYSRLFLVFDDPVTSMSYDFIFTIAQVLKNLNISNAGEISVNPALINGNTHKRPRLLILTHSSYFFNVSTSNKVVEGNAAFSLHGDKENHNLTKMAKYVAPFQQQLKEVFNVANGQSPDHRTANSIRSVLEAIGRFCRPDKSDSLTNFVQYLAGTDGIEIKSVLINTLSHGTFLEEIPPPEDLVLACKETLVVVKKYAVGQLEILGATDK